ncbi:hypothetical protein [Paraburkholderia sp. A1RO-5L]|uniref:hypothetical protein n=1 Tax=Paraburkholderia sp. A1RO-5L TaxID=3028370 RepID=UPI003B7DA02A
MSATIQTLAEARAAFVAATERSEQAHAAQSQLLVRKSEAEAAAATALSEFRAGRIAEEVAGLRKAAAEADAKDLVALIEQGAAALLKINQAVHAAKTRADEAERAAKREEHSLAAAELDKSLKQIEETFLACLAERARVQHLLTGKPSHLQSLFQYWQPTKELTEAVGSFIAPAQRKPI